MYSNRGGNIFKRMYRVACENAYAAPEIVLMDKAMPELEAETLKWRTRTARNRKESQC